MLLAVSYKLVMLVQTTFCNSTVQVKSSKTLLKIADTHSRHVEPFNIFLPNLDITANRCSLLPAVDTCQLPGPFHLPDYFTVCRIILE